MSGYSRECVIVAAESGSRCLECGRTYPMPAGAFRAQCRVHVEWTEERPRPPQGGPGTELKKLLKLVGITATPTCPCNARAAQMDFWGPDECEKRLDEIVDWLGEEAGKRRLPFVRMAATQVVRLAIRRARNAAAK